MLFLADRFAQVRVVRALWIDAHRVRTVVEMPNHAALIQWQI